MKRSILVICYILNTCILFAQTPATTDQKKPDSAFLAKPKKHSASDLKVIAGTAMIPANDIATNIFKSKELSRFNNAIQLSGLSETFKSKGPITVFVPNDQAFGKVPEGKLDTLLMPEHKYDLITLVTYHAIRGKVTISNITHEISLNKGVATFTTLAGSKLVAKIDGNRNIILIDENGGQCIISKFDIKQNNGLIHGINSVLIPKFKVI